MADWAKIKFYWKTMLGSEGSALSASSTFEGTSVENIHNMLETNRWQAAEGQGPHYITFDAGADMAFPADYLAVSGHNLSTASALVTLQYSADEQNYQDAFAPFIPPSDNAFVKEFTNPGSFRYWRVSIDGSAIAPFMYISIWGEKTELDYASASFDPHGQTAKDAVNLSYGGYLTGIHSKYIERSMSIRFEDAEEALYEKVKEWREENGARNFFVAWESFSHPEDVFLMRPEAGFTNPLKPGGAARDITISLTGRRE